MDATFLQTIIENNYTVPKGHSVSELTPKLTLSLGSINSDLRENSLSVLWGWINKGHYSPDQLRDIGSQMAHNLTVGIGESGTDTVFLRAFSVLILSAVIAIDERYEKGIIEGQSPFLSQDQVRDWLEQGLVYLEREKDRRGYVAEKGWSHAIAHTSDLLRVLARNRHTTVSDLERILNAIADKMTEPADRAYLYQEDERLVCAVISALLRNLLDMSFLKTWLDRLAHPPDQKPWDEVFEDEAKINARHNTRSFLRSLYYQMLIGINAHSTPYYEQSLAMRGELLSEIVAALRKMDHGRFYRGDN